MALLSGVGRFFDPLVAITALVGNRMSAEQKAELRGFHGAINFEITGAGGGTWHLLLGPDGARIFRGRNPRARATVRLGSDTLFKLLAGETSFMVATMSGRIRVEGEGHGGMALGALVGNFRKAAGARGLPGRVARFWKARVLEGRP